MSTLHTTINTLAETFAHDLLRALRGASLEDIISETSAGHVRRGPGRPPKAHAAVAKKSGKRVRRSADDIAKTVEKIATALKGHKNGLRSEQLQKILHIAKKDITKPITVALKSKTIRKTGQQRATTYFSGVPKSTSRPKAKKHVVAHARRAPAKRITKTKQPSTRTTNGAAQPVTAATASAS